MSRRRALMLNVAVSLTSVAGAVIAWFLLARALEILPYALAVAAASFLYVAVADLIPGLHRRGGARTTKQQDALIALLTQNTDTVIRMLHGWKTTRLIAAKDGAGVVIYSEWETPAAVEAMRADPRMKAYFPKIIELASLDSIVGSAVLSETRRG